MDLQAANAVIEHLVDRARLGHVTGDVKRSAAVLLDRADLRLRTARAGLASGDPAGAFVAAYDAYRMAAESILLGLGLRPTGGDGSHVVVEDVVSALCGSTIPTFRKTRFERFRRTRHTAQYFDPDGPDITDDDARWAIRTAASALYGTREPDP